MRGWSYLSAVLAAVFLTPALPTAARAESRAINAEQSTVTVLVAKSGLFSAFADNHIIKGGIARGTMSEESPLGIELTIHAANLKVFDPNLSADKRAEVQTRMLGPEVLDVDRFPEIGFASTTISAAGADRWSVTGRLTMHGQERAITFPVVRAAGRYRGQVVIKQRDFGIEPIKVAGGTVKVKDELTIQFEIGR